jgi:NitT/TauT family transport system permease protein
MLHKNIKNKFINFSHPVNMRIFSFILLLLVWQVSSFIIKSDVLPSPKTVLTIFFDEMINGEMLYHLSITLWRVILAFTIAMLVGTGLGIAMGSRKNVNIMLDGWHILLLNTPALVIIILCYVWFGLNEIAAITAVALNKIPNVLVTIREGTRAIDRKILQVADVFKVNYKKKFISFFLPQLYPFIMAAARGGISLIWKIVLVVELLGRSDGIGFKLNEFFNLFDIASIFAYTLSFVAVMVFVEYAIIGPIERRLNKWRTI